MALQFPVSPLSVSDAREVFTLDNYETFVEFVVSSPVITMLLHSYLLVYPGGGGGCGTGCMCVAGGGGGGCMCVAGGGGCMCVVGGGGGGAGCDNCVDLGFPL